MKKVDYYKQYFATLVLLILLVSCSTGMKPFKRSIPEMEIPFISIVDGPYKSISQSQELKLDDLSGTISTDILLSLKIVRSEGIHFRNGKDTKTYYLKDLVSNKDSINLAETVPKITFQLKSEWPLENLKLVPIIIKVYYSENMVPVDYRYITQFISYAK